MQNRSIKKIGFFGYEYSDIAWYLARMYAYTGGQIVMVDMTSNKRVLASLCMLKSEELPTEIVEKGIRVVNGGAFKEAAVGEVECIVYCFDYKWDGVSMTDMTDIILVTDMMQSNATMLSPLNVSEFENVRVVVRNTLYLKYSVKTLVELTSVRYDGSKVYELPYDEADYRNRCYMCVDKKDKLKKLSPPMSEMLVRLYVTLFGDVTKRRMKEILRKA